MDKQDSSKPSTETKAETETQDPGKAAQKVSATGKQVFPDPQPPPDPKSVGGIAVEIE